MAKVDNFDYNGKFAIFKMYTASSTTSDYAQSGYDAFLIVSVETTENHRCIIFEDPDTDRYYLLGDPEGGYTVKGIDRVTMNKTIRYDAEDPREFTWGYVQDNKSYVSSDITQEDTLYNDVFANTSSYVYDYSDIINATRPFYDHIQSEEDRSTTPNKYSNLLKGNPVVRQYTSSQAMYDYQATLLNPDYKNLVANQTAGGMPIQLTDEKNAVLGKGILLSSDFEACQQYIDDGTIPDDAMYMTDNDDGDPDEGTNGQDDSRFPASDLTPPNATTLTASPNNYYVTAPVNIQTFFDEFWGIDWSALILNSITGLYGNVSNAVISLKLFPFSAAKLNDSGSAERVKLARITFDTTYNTISKTAVPTMHTAGTIKVAPRGTKRTFKDYAPYTSMQVYLPLYGYLDLDVNIFMNRNLTVKYTIDIQAGIITYYILCGSFLVNVVSAQCGFDIPFSLSYGNEVMSATVQNMAQFGVAMASGVMTKSPVGMVQTALGSSTSEVNNLNCRGAAENNGWLYADPQCYLIMKRPNFNRPNNYGEKVGFPLYQQRVLGNISGFTKCINATLSFDSVHPTDEEYNEIKTLLEGGVYI